MSTIHLNWVASTDNIAVTNYLIERQSPGGGSFVQIATTPATSYDDTTVTAGSSYSYRVRATDAASNLSDYSGVASVTGSTPDTTAPSTPASLAATATGANTINLSWAASTDDVAVTGYLIERSITTGIVTSAWSQIGSTASLAYSDIGLIASTIYNYRIRATDAASNLSGYSTTATTTTLAGAFSIADNFNRANASSLGSNWTLQTTGTALKITSNQCAPSADNVHCLAYWNASTFSNDQYAQCVIANSVLAWTGVILRADNLVDQCYLAFVYNGTVSFGDGTFFGVMLYARWAGTFVLLAAAEDPSWVVGDILTAKVRGTTHPITLEAYRNGNLVAFWTSTDSTYVRTGGNPGAGIFQRPGDTLRLDDWTGGDLSDLYVADSFDRADGALGANWTPAFFSESTLVVAGNHCGVALESKHCYAFWNASSFHDDQYSQSRWFDVAGTVSFTGLILRADATQDKFYIGVVTQRNELTIMARWAGAFHTLSVITLPANMVNGTMIRFEVVGSAHPFSLKMYVHIGDTTGPTKYVATWSSTDNTYARTGGSPGIGIFSQPTMNRATDDWSGGNL